MSKDFILPDIGEGIVECEVVEWKVKEGDTIMEDQIVVDVSTDKAIVEIPSMYTPFSFNNCKSSSLKSSPMGPITPTLGTIPGFMGR